MSSIQTASTIGTAAAPFPWFDFNDAVAALPRLQKEDIRARLLDQLESALAYLLPRGKRRGAQFVVGNVQGDAGDSLVVDLDGAKRGLWLDFATGESGDALALWAAVCGFILPQQFDALLEDIGQWLVVPRVAVPITVPSSAHDDLGPATAKWNYHDANGKLLACVYRYDLPGGKQYRPWHAASRSMRMPDPRPLYNLPAIAASNDVVLVEGEKCADALMHLGITATTAMGGAATAIEKTDWTPLAGKTVVVWPDHDEAGSRYADAVIPRLRQVGVKVRRVTVPQDKPKKWDAADAVSEGFDVSALLHSSAPVADDLQHLEVIAISQWRALDRFTGQPQARRWLVEGVFPQAQAALVAAAGGVGKSFLLLALAREVAACDGTKDNAPIVFGSALAGHGVAIYITAEDDAIEVHNRLNALGPIPDRLYVLPLPDAGGAQPLFAPDPATRGPGTTAAWLELERQLRAMAGLRMVVLDPLQPLCALDLNVPENAQFVCSRLAALAARTGAAVIVSHHFAKREATTPEQAREAIRGTGGLVDGVRSVYALWQPKEEQARTLCKTLGEPFERGRVVLGGVVKANGQADLHVTTFLRDARGLLVDRSQDVRRTAQPDIELLPELKAAIARAAAAGQPYTKTGGNGIYERRHELPQAFQSIGKHRLSEWVSALLDREELVMAMAEGSKLVKWLDVPDGPVANGAAQFVTGHLGRSSAGRR